MSDRDGRLGIANDSITFESDSQRCKHLSLQIPSTLNGNITYQKKNIKSEVMPSYINEFVMATSKSLRKIREDKQCHRR